jgi:hypothetical protein
MELGEWDIDTSITRIRDLHIFTLCESDTFFHDGDILPDPMFPMDDEVSFADMEEEVEIADTRFSDTIFEKYLSDDIITDYGIS